MKHLTVYFLLALQGVLFSFSLSAATPQNAIAYHDGNVRFSVLTDGVIRMEWSPSGSFTDDPSFVAIHRNLPVPKYTVQNKNATVVISTARMKLKYKKGQGPFTKDNLTITSAKGMFPFQWTPGTIQKGNLKGTDRTLDGFEGDHNIYSHQDMKLEDGLLSTDGWTLIDDSKNFLFDNSEWAWVKEREHKDGQDWYFMAYGHDYKAALKDFTVFAGKVPLPPRYAFGYWWSRYWSYSDKEMRQLVDNFHTYNIPLDVLVVDMDWHYTDPGFGGWTGWTWNRRLFPNPAKFLGYLKSNDLKITLNLHPADGVAPYEEKYPEMAQWMGVDTAKQERIPWVVSDKRFINGMFNKVLRPMEKQGVDFWWLDWQQWMYDKKVDSLSNTWWINYVFFSDMERNRDTRPMLYHRWGGLGNHRYQIGFSGDAVISWKSLEFQPYFTNCASNVLYGYWSHDIGGHMFKGGDKEILDPELFTRWMQYGALTPVMRTHSTKNSVLNKELWNFKGDYFEALRNSILFRYQLAPYIYTMARETYDNGISICRPMYYDYPEAKEAYDFRNEYMFGDQILVAPITTPMQNGLSTVKVWLPEGTWFDFFNGMIYEGGRSMDLYRTLEEIPVLAKAGAIIPMTEKISALDVESNPDELTVRVYAGADNTFALYEDDNTTMAYEKDDCAKTSMTLDWGARKFTIAPVEGNQSLVPESRMYCVEFGGSTAKEAKVFVNGVEADAEVKEKDGLLTIAVTDVKPQDTVTICLPEDTEIAKNDVMTRAMDLLLHAEISYITKEQIANLLHKADGKVAILAAELQSMELSNDLRGALLEIITA